MANQQNLRPKPFTSEYQPANRGRKKGSKNFSTRLIELVKRLEPGATIDANRIKKLCREHGQRIAADKVYLYPQSFIIK